MRSPLTGAARRACRVAVRLQVGLVIIRAAQGPPRALGRLASLVVRQPLPGHPPLPMRARVLRRCHRGVVWARLQALAPQARCPWGALARGRARARGTPRLAASDWSEHSPATALRGSAGRGAGCGRARRPFRRSCAASGPRLPRRASQRWRCAEGATPIRVHVRRRREPRRSHRAGCRRAVGPCLQQEHQQQHGLAPRQAAPATLQIARREQKATGRAAMPEPGMPPGGAMMATMRPLLTLEAMPPASRRFTNRAVVRDAAASRAASPELSRPRRLGVVPTGLGRHRGRGGGRLRSRPGLRATRRVRRSPQPVAQLCNQGTLTWLAAARRHARAMPTQTGSGHSHRRLRPPAAAVALEQQHQHQQQRGRQSPRGQLAWEWEWAWTWALASSRCCEQQLPARPWSTAAAANHKPHLVAAAPQCTCTSARTPDSSRPTASQAEGARLCLPTALA